MNKTIRSGRSNTGASRRHLLRGALAGVGTAALTGCDRLSNNEAFVDVLKSAQHLAARRTRSCRAASRWRKSSSPPTWQRTSAATAR